MYVNNTLPLAGCGARNYQTFWAAYGMTHVFGIGLIVNTKLWMTRGAIKLYSFISPYTTVGRRITEPWLVLIK